MGCVLADGEVRVEIGDEVVGNGIGNPIETLDDGEAIADFAHDDGNGSVEGICNRSEDLRAGLFLASLHLAQVTESNTGLARDLTKGSTLLQAEVPEHISDFLAY